MLLYGESEFRELVFFKSEFKSKFKSVFSKLDFKSRMSKIAASSPHKHGQNSWAKVRAFKVDMYFLIMFRCCLLGNEYYVA